MAKMNITLLTRWFSSWSSRFGALHVVDKTRAIFKLGPNTGVSKFNKKWSSMNSIISVVVHQGSIVSRAYFVPRWPTIDNHLIIFLEDKVDFPYPCDEISNAPPTRLPRHFCSADHSTKKMEHKNTAYYSLDYDVSTVTI